MESRFDTESITKTEKSRPQASSKGVEYVLDMLGELTAVAELAGAQALSDDIQNILDNHTA